MKNTAIIMGGIVLIVAMILCCCITFVVVSPGDSNSGRSRSSQSEEGERTHQSGFESESTEKVEENTEQQTNVSLSYDIVDEYVVRYDQGKTYIVLVEQVDLTDESFKSDIKNVVREIVELKGEKLSIEIFDNKEAIKIYSDKWNSDALFIPDEKQQKFLGEHMLASYAGNLETGMSLNDLYFFPAAETSHDVVGQYIGYEEFDPTKD